MQPGSTPSYDPAAESRRDKIPGHRRYPTAHRGFRVTLLRTIIRLLIVAIFLGYVPAASAIQAPANREDTLALNAYQPPIQFDVSAGGALLLSAGKDRKLLAKRDFERRQTALAAKLMTAYIVSQRITPGTLITISEDAAIGEITADGVILRQGEKYSFEYLLQRLIFYDSNSAAIALAEQVSSVGSRFVEMMNNQAQTLGLTSMRFTSSDGREPRPSDPNAELSASAAPAASPPTQANLLDIAILFNAALKSTAFNACMRRFDYIALANNETVIMRNRMASAQTLTDERVQGVYYTEEAGRYTLLTAATVNGMTCSLVLADGDPAEVITDLNNVLDTLAAYYTMKTLTQAGAPVSGLQEKTADGESFGLLFQTTMTYIDTIEGSLIDQNPVYKPLGPFRRPLEVNQVVGSMTFRLVDGSELTVNVTPDRQILSSNSVFNLILSTLNRNRNLLVVLLAAAGLLILALVLHTLRRIRRLAQIIQLYFLIRRQ